MFFSSTAVSFYQFRSKSKPSYPLSALANAMISVLARERLLGAAMGSVLTGAVIFDQRRSIYESISDTQSQPREPVFGRSSRSEIAHIWNKSVDETLGPIIKSLSSSGW